MDRLIFLLLNAIDFIEGIPYTVTYCVEMATWAILLPFRLLWIHAYYRYNLYMLWRELDRTERARARRRGVEPVKTPNQDDSKTVPSIFELVEQCYVSGQGLDVEQLMQKAVNYTGDIMIVLESSSEIKEHLREKEGKE